MKSLLWWIFSLRICFIISTPFFCIPISYDSFSCFLSACQCFFLSLRVGVSLSVLFFYPQSCQCSSPLCFPTCMLTMSPLFGAEQRLTLTQFISQKGSSWPQFDWSNLSQSHCGVRVPWQQELCVLLNEREMYV